MSNSQEASAILSELDQFAAGFTDLIKTKDGRRDALLLHDKLGMLKAEPNLFHMLSRMEKEIVVSMAYHWLAERMMSDVAQRDQ